MLWRALSVTNHWASRNPLAAAVAVGTTKNCVCDLMVQCSCGGTSIDWRRLGIFTVFGACYVGAAQHVLFNAVFPRLLPGLTQQTRIGVLGAVVLDNFVHSETKKALLMSHAHPYSHASMWPCPVPFFYLPTFYCIRELAHSDGPASSAIATGLRFHREHLVEDVQLQAAIFVPVQLANFGYNPPHLRVPAVVAAGAVWISALSYRRGDRKAAQT